MSAGDYFPAHYSVLFPSIQQSIIRAPPAAFALWGEIPASATSRNSFCFVCSSEPDGGLFLSGVSCHYFTAVGGESSPPQIIHLLIQDQTPPHTLLLHVTSCEPALASPKVALAHTGDRWARGMCHSVEPSHLWRAMLIVCPRCAHIHSSEVF